MTSKAAPTHVLLFLVALRRGNNRCPCSAGEPVCGELRN